MDNQSTHTSPQRIFRAAILNNTTPPPAVVAVLESVGINTDELEHRLRQQMEHRG